MARFEGSTRPKDRNRFKRPNRTKPGLTLPRQLVSELSALGHHHPTTSSQGKYQKGKRPAFDRTKKSNSAQVQTQLKSHAPTPKLEDQRPSIPTSTTALGKLLAKQDGTSKPESKKRKQRSSEEDIEDARIAWLERELGMAKGPQGQSKLRQEFEEDGLEDLFDGLEELDKLADTLRKPTSITEDEDVDLEEDEPSDDESEWSGCHGDMVIDEGPCVGQDNIQEQQPDPLKVQVDNEEQDDMQYLQSDPQPSVSVSSRYVPPHLRQKGVLSPVEAAVKLDPRLRRQLMGILNRVSPTTIPTCLESLRGLYTTHARAVVTEGLVEVILELVGARDELGAALAVTYSAMIAAISRGGVQVSGVEIGWAPSFIAALTCRLCAIYEQSVSNGETGKSGPNLLSFLSHLYFFQVIGCALVYDFVRLLINEGLNEARVEGLMVLLKNAGPRLRHDDPVALKEIVQMAQANKKDVSEGSSRTKYMFETLLDLKNNKIRKEAQAASSTTEELKETLKKYLGGLAKKSSAVHDPLQLTLKDLKEARKRGKWWLIGAAWDGDPLLELDDKPAGTADGNEALIQLARQQGMNTDVRRSIFTTLMTSEDYVDASEKVTRLGLTAVQQREIVRVLLHCLGNETNYNPYYTLVGQKLASESHSFQITLQFALWDFFRDLGETEVGGREMLKGLTPSNGRGASLDQEDGSLQKRIDHFASAYGWWIAKGSLSIVVLKTLPFGQLRSQHTTEFLTKLLGRIIISLNATSPSLASSTVSIRVDRTGLERVFGKARGTELGDGLAEFLDAADRKLWCPSEDGRCKELVGAAHKAIIDVLSSGGLI